MRLLRNAFSLLISYLLASALSIAITGYTARYLGPVIYGRFTFAIALVALLSPIANPGVDKITVCRIAVQRPHAELHIGVNLFAKLLLSTGVSVLVIAIAYISNYSSEVISFIWIALVNLWLTNMDNSLNAVLQAFEAMHYQAGLMVLSAFIRLGIVWYFVAHSYPVIWVVMTLIIPSLLSSLLKLHILWKNDIKMSFIINLGALSNLLWNALPLGISVLLGTLHSRIGTLLLSYMVGDEAVGYYGAAYKLLDTVALLPSAVAIAVFPMLSVFSQASARDKLTFAYYSLSKYSFILALPLAVVLSMLSREVMHIIYGEAYIISARALCILSWVLFLQFFNIFFSNFIIACGEQRYLLFITVAGVCINMALTFILVPSMSFVGVALATLVGELTVFVLDSIILYARLSLYFSWNVVVYLLGAGVVMGSTMWFFKGFLPWPFVAGLGAAIYGGLVLLRTELWYEDWVLIKGKFFRRRV